MKNFFSQMLKLSLLCFILGPMLAMSAPAPVFENLMNKFKGKGKEEGSSSGNNQSGMAKARFHVEPRVGMAANEQFKQHDQIVANAKSALSENGRRIHRIYSTAYHISDLGYVPQTSAIKFGGGSVKDLIQLEKESLPYVKSVKKVEQYRKEVLKAANDLQPKIDIYANSHLPDQGQKLLKLQTNLLELAKYLQEDNLPHKAYSHIKLLFPSQRSNQEALDRFREQMNGISGILAEHNIALKHGSSLRSHDH